MAILGIRLHPDPVLRERTREVAEVDDSVRKLVADLEDTMRATPNGVGLAAPQVGVLRRVLVYDVGDGLRTLVNPAIGDSSGVDVGDEGCLSIPGLWFPVARATRVQVTAKDANGTEISYDAVDLEARVIQHEVDHLDGVLFIDRLEPDLRRQARAILREQALFGAAPAPRGVALM